MNCNFKPGDRVICIDDSSSEWLKNNGKSYIISDTLDIFVILVDDESKYTYLFTRFEYDIRTIRKDKLKQLLS